MKICIIGGGLSGTIACKWAKQRGHSPIILEKTDKTSGVYSLIYDKERYKLSSSKFITSFSDHLPDSDYRVWMSIQEFQNYIDSYIKKFNLLKYFKFNCTAKFVEHFSNHVKVYYENGDGVLVDQIFDKLIVCTGLNQNPKYKDVNGINTFPGEKVHTHDIYTNTNYHTEVFFKNKTILMLGGGESSFDIGHEVAKYGKKLYYHTDNDVEWFAEGGLEVDKNTGNRFNNCFKDMDSSYFGKNNFNYFVKNSDKPSAPNDTILTRAEYTLNPLYSQLWQSYISRELGPGNYQNRCSHGVKKLCKNNKRNIFAKYLVKRSNFLCDIKSDKTVKILRDNINLKEHKLYNNNKFIDNIDIVIYATGYRPKLEFLSEQIKNDKYIKNIIPENHQNIAFIGFTRPTMGSILIIAEMQTMWTMLYFENKLDYTIRQKSIFRSIDPLKLKNKFLRHLVINNYYLEDLGKDMKICPNLTKLYFNDRKLWYHLFYGMSHPISFRLHGEYYDKNARDNLIKFYKQTFKLRNNYQTKFVNAFTKIRILLTLIIIIIILIIISFLYFYGKLSKK